jgi:hypothetical protein
LCKIFSAKGKGYNDLRQPIGYAKQIEGFMTRIISKISAFTIMQYINYSLGKPIGHIKYALD